MSCTPEPGPQPIAPVAPVVSVPTLSDTVTTLVGTWYWDSTIQYSSGVRSVIAISPAAGGNPALSNDQRVTFTKDPYNGTGTGAAIGSNTAQATLVIGGTLSNVYSWALESKFPLTKINAPGNYNGNIYSVTANRLVVTDYSGSGVKNGLFYYHHK